VGGVKVLAYPLLHLVTFLAVRPGEDFLELREAVDATAVLRWAGAFTGDTRRIGLAILGDGAGFDDEFVLPAVPVAAGTGAVMGDGRVRRLRGQWGLGRVPAGDGAGWPGRR